MPPAHTADIAASHSTSDGAVAPRPRKVLHVLNGAAGGAALSAMGLMESFARQGIASCAVCDLGGSDRERDALRAATQDQVLFTPLYWWSKKIRSKLWKRPLLELWELWRTGWGQRSAGRVAEFARQQGADLIHTNTFLTPEGGIAARRLGLPHVWHLREIVGPGGFVRLTREDASLGRYLAKHASAVVANSHVTAAAIRAWVPDDLLHVVHNGIDLSRFRVRENYSTHGRPLVVGMVANLTTSGKKHALFVQAAAQVDRALPVQFRIYGHGQSVGSGSAERYAESIRQLATDLGVGDRFAWPGHIADPVQIMAELDVLVHPTDIESFGRVVVEAMAGGLPVVGVRAGGVGEIVQDGVTGILAEPDRADQLAAGIERLVRDEQLRRMLGRAGRVVAEEKYTLEGSAAGVLGVYETAMRRPLGISS